MYFNIKELFVSKFVIKSAFPRVLLSNASIRLLSTDIGNLSLLKLILMARSFLFSRINVCDLPPSDTKFVSFILSHTHSLSFLHTDLTIFSFKYLFILTHKMETLKDDFKFPISSQNPLKVLIIGAGITGLTTALALSLTGNKVSIYEAAHSLTEIGAGLQIAPNASRILARLGVLEEIMKKANVLEEISFRRWEDDEEIGTARLMPGVS
jgi:hypothetical protein